MNGPMRAQFLFKSPGFDENTGVGFKPDF